MGLRPDRRRARGLVQERWFLAERGQVGAVAAQVVLGGPKAMIVDDRRERDQEGGGEGECRDRDEHQRQPRAPVGAAPACGNEQHERHEWRDKRGMVER